MLLYFFHLFSYIKPFCLPFCSPSSDVECNQISVTPMKWRVVQFVQCVTFNTLPTLIVSLCLRGSAAVNDASFSVWQRSHSGELWGELPPIFVFRLASPCWFSPWWRQKTLPLNRLSWIISHSEELPILSYDNFSFFLFCSDLSFLLTVPDGGRKTAACQSCWTLSVKSEHFMFKTRRQSLTGLRVCAWDEE